MIDRAVRHRRSFLLVSHVTAATSYCSVMHADGPLLRAAQGADRGLNRIARRFQLRPRAQQHPPLSQQRPLRLDRRVLGLLIARPLATRFQRPGRSSVRLPAATFVLLLPRLLWGVASLVRPMWQSIKCAGQRRFVSREAVQNGRSTQNWATSQAVRPMTYQSD
jgi:hypothetical protein